MVCENPDIVAKRTKFILNIFKSRSIIDDSFNFRTRLEHTLGLQDSLYVAFTITSNRINIKMIKTASDNISFIQNRKPAEATLETFKAEMFKLQPIIMNRPPPLMIVIGLIQRRSRPLASRHHTPPCAHTRTSYMRATTRPITR